MKTVLLGLTLLLTFSVSIANGADKTTSSTPKQAAQKFFKAVILKDNTLGETVIIKTPDSSLLWKGEKPPEQARKIIDKALGSLEIKEIKDIGSIKLPPGLNIEKRKELEGKEQKFYWLIIMNQKNDIPLHLVKIKDDWKVVPDFFIQQLKSIPQKIQYLQKEKPWPLAWISQKEWSMFLPPDWRNTTLKSRAIELIRVDGTNKLLPFFDGSRQPLRMGIFVEELNKDCTIDSEIKKYRKEFASDSTRKLRGKCNEKDITLGDKIKGKSFSYQIDELRTGRLFFYDKILFKPPSEKLIIVTSYIACGQQSSDYVKKSGIHNLLKAFITSVSSKNEVNNVVPIRKAYNAIDWNILKAIELGMQATRLLEKNNKKAIQLFNESIKLCDFIPFVYNNLATIYAEAEDKSFHDYRKAIELGKRAVSLTEEKDPMNLDTLAVAYFKNNEKEKAIKAIKKAIALNPGKQRYQDLLKGFQKK